MKNIFKYLNIKNLFNFKLISYQSNNFINKYFFNSNKIDKYMAYSYNNKNKHIIKLSKYQNLDINNLIHNRHIQKDIDFQKCILKKDIISNQIKTLENDKYIVLYLLINIILIILNGII